MKYLRSASGMVIVSRRRVLLTLSSNRDDARARDYVIQGLYLVGVRSFENFIEGQIVGLATGKLSWKPRVIGPARCNCTTRFNEKRLSFANELIFAGKEYADYLPYQRTTSIAKRIFVSGRPFSLLGDNEKSTINRCIKVRHYIAHNSDHAARDFVKTVTAIKKFRVKKPSVTHYLNENIRSGVSFFEHDLATLVSAAKFLS